MRVTINLATRPYVNLDRLFRQLRIAIGVLLVLAAALAVVLHQRTAAAREDAREIEVINAKTAELAAERRLNEARLREPRNAAVLQQVEFLNGLFQRKSFSWTAVLMDLEEVLPSGVQVTSIDPLVLPNGEVSIRMRVSGPRERSVQLVRNLERSHRFLAPRLVGEAQQQQEKRSDIVVPAAYLNGPQQPGSAAPLAPPTDFDIVAGYNPLQPRVRERVSRTRPSAADAADAELNP